MTAKKNEHRRSDSLSSTAIWLVGKRFLTIPLKDHGNLLCLVVPVRRCGLWRVDMSSACRLNHSVIIKNCPIFTMCVSYIGDGRRSLAVKGRILGWYGGNHQVRRRRMDV